LYHTTGISFHTVEKTNQLRYGVLSNQLPKNIVKDNKKMK
jgi:hypothetical protein